MPETAVFDHYEVMTRDDGSLFELGRGAMGITYKAFDTSLRIPVALKVVNSTYLNSEIARQRFIREARSAAKLRHRHVASVFHLGTEGETWFYAMEFIDGETLDALIKRQGPLAPTVALTITAQVARALNAASQHELVHRDIKPANLMLVKEDDDLVAKVIDFGLAKSAIPEGEDAATLSMGGFIGTPHFASPEQLEEKQIDVRSDIYSLGVTLWYMLAGQAPFAGSMAQVMSQHLSKPPPFEKLDSLPPVIAGVLRKMLAKDPAERFQTPTELRKAIEAAMEQIANSPAAAAAAAPDAEENFATLLEDSSVHAGMGSFETNTIIAGRYRVAETLGETNAGRLFHAYDTQQQREVRLIVLPPAALGDTAALTALEREVEKLAKVRHPNLLGVIDFETIDRGSFLVLEWTDGFSLLDLLKARRELEANEALKLLAQAATGVDHALGLGLTGLEFGLHQVQIHFPQPIEKDALLRTRLSHWPAFDLKLYPLGATRDIATSQTWAGGRTMVGGGASSSAEGGDVRPQYIQALAAIIYEVLGGTLSPLVLRGAGGPTMRYTPLSTLSEEGNEVLKRALDPSRSFGSAKEFSDALGRLDALQVVRHESKVHPAPSRSPGTHTPPVVAQKAAASHIPPPPVQKAAAPVPTFTPHRPKKIGFALICGVAAIITAAGIAVVMFLNKAPAPKTDTVEEPPPVLTDEKKGDVEQPKLVADNPPPATPIPSTPVSSTPKPATPPPAPTRQELLQAAVKSATALEEDGEWEKSLRAWLSVAKEYPEYPVGKNHLETLLDHLRQRPSPMSPQEFKDMRVMITEAAQFDILSAMMLLADNIRAQEPVTAFNWYSAAAEKDFAPALTQLGLMLSNKTVPGTPDLEKAAKCFQAAADKGDAAGNAALGDCYYLGQGVPERSIERAIHYYREAISHGDLRAMNRLGDVLYKDVGGEDNCVEAFHLFTKASERGSLEALGNLGVLYLKGAGVPSVDQRKAAGLFEKGARGGNGFCMRLYAQCYEDGIGIGKNLLQAQNWYRKAAEAGDRKAADWCRENGVSFTPKN
jgi:serine/threonine protein kinase/TPR repeat protein